MRRTEKPAGPLIAIKVLRAVNSPFEKAAEPKASRGAPHLIPVATHATGGMVKGFDLLNDLMAAPRGGLSKTSLDRICSHGLWVTNSFVGIVGDG